MKVLLISAICSGIAFGQVSLTAQPPPPVTVAGGIAVGARGGSTLYYWVIARYPAGTAQPSTPAIVANTVGEFNLTVSNYVTVSWSPMPGATGYDVLRSGSPMYPASPTCAACAVVLNTAGSSVNDTGGALSAYPPGGVTAAVQVNGYITINNRDESTPFVNLQLMSLRINELLRVGLISGTPADHDCLKYVGGRVYSAGAPCGSGGSVDPNMVTAAGTLISNAPMIGAGSKAAAVGTRSGNTTEFVTQSGSKTAGKQTTYDASGNLITSAYDVGATGTSGNSLVTATATVATIAAGGVGALSTSTGLMTSVPLASATITRTTANSESGTIRVGVAYNSGSPIYRCYFSTAGGDGLLTPANYTLSGVSCVAGDAFGIYDFQLATIAVSAGNLSTTPVDLRQPWHMWAFEQDTGILIVGNKIKADPAVVPFKAGATTGMPVGSVSSAPSSPNNGDMWYDTTLNKLRCRQNGATVDCIGSGGTPAGSTNYLQYNIAGAFSAEAALTYDPSTNSLNISDSNSSGSAANLYLGNSAASNFNSRVEFRECVNNSFPDCTLLIRNWNSYNGSNQTYTQLYNWDGAGVNQLIGMGAIDKILNFGGSGSGYFALSANSGSSPGVATRYGDQATAGRGIPAILGAPTEATGQTGDVAASNLLAASHTAGMYRICGFVAVTATGTGSTAAWTLSWRSPASGSDLAHNLFFSSGAAATDTFSVAASNEFNTCKVIRSTGASAIALNPGDMNTSTFSMAWTVERLR